MIAYIFRRVLFFGLTLLLTSLMVFAAVRLLPGDVETAVLGRGAEPAARAALRQELGLDLPFFVQYANWLSGFLCKGAVFLFFVGIWLKETYI